MAAAHAQGSVRTAAAKFYISRCVLVYVCVCVCMCSDVNIVWTVEFTFQFVIIQVKVTVHTSLQNYKKNTYF